MDAEQHNTNQTPQGRLTPKENPELGIKRVRTFAEDLAYAKKKAGVKDEEPPKKKAGLFGKKKPPKISAKKDLSKVQPEVDVSRMPKAEEKEAVQPAREIIEQELARSGIVKREQVQEESEDVSVPRIRTYKYDAAETIEEKGASKISMVAAEQQRRAENNDFSQTFNEPEREMSIKKIVTLSLLSVVLIGTGIWSAVFFFNKSRVDTDTALQVSQNVLFTNATLERNATDIEGKDLVNLIYAGADAAPSERNYLTEIELRDRNIFGDQKLSKDALFNKLNTNASGRLIRSFGEGYVVGAHSGNEKSVFYLFKINDFDTAFAEMLEWEDSLHLYLYGSFEGQTFVDEYLRNKDTRIQRDGFGNIQVIYSFPNSETLIITQNEEAFFELFERLTVSNATQN